MSQCHPQGGEPVLTRSSSSAALCTGPSVPVVLGKWALLGTQIQDSYEDLCTSEEGLCSLHLRDSGKLTWGAFPSRGVIHLLLPGQGNPRILQRFCNPTQPKVTISDSGPRVGPHVGTAPPPSRSDPQLLQPRLLAFQHERSCLDPWWFLLSFRRQ